MTSHDELRELAAKARLPWRDDGLDSFDAANELEVTIVDQADELLAMLATGVINDGTKISWDAARATPANANAQLIVGAVNALPALLDDNARLAARVAALETWVGKRREREKRARLRYRERHPEVHRKSSRESMARIRAARAALAAEEGQ